MSSAKSNSLNGTINDNHHTGYLFMLSIMLGRIFSSWALPPREGAFSAILTKDSSQDCSSFAQVPRVP